MRFPCFNCSEELNVDVGSLLCPVCRQENICVPCTCGKYLVGPRAQALSCSSCKQLVYCSQVLPPPKAPNSGTNLPDDSKGQLSALKKLLQKEFPGQTLNYERYERFLRKYTNTDPRKIQLFWKEMDPFGSGHVRVADLFASTSTPEDEGRLYPQFTVVNTASATVQQQPLPASMLHQTPHTQHTQPPPPSLPQQSPYASTEHVGIGITVYWGDDGIPRIQKILDNGSAAQSKRLQEGDCILSVDGVEVSGTSLAELTNRIIGPPNSIVRLGIFRKDHVFEIDICRLKTPGPPPGMITPPLMVHHSQPLPSSQQQQQPQPQQQPSLQHHHSYPQPPPAVGFVPPGPQQQQAMPLHDYREEEDHRLAMQLQAQMNLEEEENRKQQQIRDAELARKLADTFKPAASSTLNQPPNHPLPSIPVPSLPIQQQQQHTPRTPGDHIMTPTDRINPTTPTRRGSEPNVGSPVTGPTPRDNFFVPHPARPAPKPPTEPFAAQMSNTSNNIINNNNTNNNIGTNMNSNNNNNNNNLIKIYAAAQRPGKDMETWRKCEFQNGWGLRELNDYLRQKCEVAPFELTELQIYDDSLKEYALLDSPGDITAGCKIKVMIRSSSFGSGLGGVAGTTPLGMDSASSVKLPAVLFQATSTTAAASSTFKEINYNDLTMTKKIATGASKTVWLGEWWGNKVAISQLHKLGEVSEKELSDFRAELDLLAGLSHPNIVLLIGAVTKPEAPAMCIVTEYMDRGCLHDVLHKSTQVLTKDNKDHILQGLAAGLNFLHLSKICHRDIKSLNVLVDINYTAKLTDFGVSRKLEEQRIAKTMVGTSYWMAPEIMQHHQYDPFAADVYSMALVFYEVVAQKLPYSHCTNQFELMMHVTGRKRPELVVGGYLTESLRNLIQWMWHSRADIRPTMPTVLKLIHEMLDSSDFFVAAVSDDPPEAEAPPPPPQPAASPASWLAFSAATPPNPFPNMASQNLMSSAPVHQPPDFSQPSDYAPRPDFSSNLISGIRRD